MTDDTLRAVFGVLICLCAFVATYGIYKPLSARTLMDYANRMSKRAKDFERATEERTARLSERLDAMECRVEMLEQENQRLDVRVRRLEQEIDELRREL
jgi:TolA-binding protein